MAAALAIVGVAALGCRRRDVELVRVSGRVTLDGQAPPGPGTLYFAPTEAAGGQPLRPATAHFAADGLYQVNSFDEGDGLVPGRYQVSVHCWKVEPTIDGPPAVSHIAARYMSAGTSALELVVESGARRMEWDVPLTSQ
jgi:hypothetical protein